jgi:DNA-binding transcriptional LysR family regulator
MMSSRTASGASGDIRYGWIGKYDARDEGAWRRYVSSSSSVRIHQSQHHTNFPISSSSKASRTKLSRLTRLTASVASVIRSVGERAVETPFTATEYSVKLQFMLSLDDLRLLATVEASSSLAAASRALDVTPPAVTQRLRQIEARLGLKLIDRSHRRLQLTSEGELIVARGRSILAEVDELTETLTAQRDSVTGHLRVFAPLGFGRRYVAASAERFHRLYPDVTVALELSDRGDRLPQSVHDVVIHIGELRDSTRKFRRIAPNQRLVCASPDYLRLYGVPTHPNELRDHHCLVLRENDEDVSLWRFDHKADDRQLNVRVGARLSSNDGEVVRRWGVAGEGVIVRSEWDVRDDIRAGRLTVLFEDWTVPSADVVAFVRPQAERPARVHRFLQCLIADLTPTPWREGS